MRSDYPTMRELTLIVLYGNVYLPYPIECDFVGKYKCNDLDLVNILSIWDIIVVFISVLCVVKNKSCSRKVGWRWGSRWVWICLKRNTQIQSYWIIGSYSCRHLVTNEITIYIIQWSKDGIILVNIEVSI